MNSDIGKWSILLIPKCECGHPYDQHHETIEKDDFLEGEDFTEGCMSCGCEQIYNPKWLLSDIRATKFDQVNRCLVDGALTFKGDRRD